MGENKKLKPVDVNLLKKIKNTEEKIAQFPGLYSLLIEKYRLELSANLESNAARTLERMKESKRGLSLAKRIEAMPRTAARRKVPGKYQLGVPSNADNLHWEQLRAKLESQEPLRIVSLNDNGFLYGAGIAAKRQMLSFLASGHQVGGVCWNSELSYEHAFSGSGVSRSDGWLGMTVLDHASFHSGMENEDVCATIVNAVLNFNPDLVIVGNLHASSWPVEALLSLNRSSVPVVCYAHDCDWVTGGCAHGGYYGCSKFLSECRDEECPKPTNAYPPNTEGKIYSNWNKRSIVFNSKSSIPIATNSCWTNDVYQARFTSNPQIKVVHLGIDTDLYKIGDKQAARRSLGIPDDCFVVLAGSSSFREPGKGASDILSVFNGLSDYSDIHFLLFGHPDHSLDSQRITQAGYIWRDEDMVKLYQAADVFLNPVRVESFGQTMLEASACGCPIVCYPVCGVSDIAKADVNALLVDTGDVQALSKAVLQIRENDEFAATLSRRGRKFVETNFSLKAQYTRWIDFLRQVCQERLFEETLHRHAWIRSNTRFDQKNIIGAMNQGGLRARGREKVDTPESPLVTIVSVVFNDLKALKCTAHSILEQNYPNLEWIVVDGGSTDGTVEYLTSLGDLVDFWISEADNGIYDAMNKAAELARGRWTIYMNAGDFFCSRHSIANLLEGRAEGADVIVGHVLYRKESGETELALASDFEMKWQNLVEGKFFHEPWMAGLPPHQSTLMRTNLIRTLKFDTTIKVSADWDLIFRAKSSGASFSNVDEVVAVYLAGGFSAQNSIQWVKDVWAIANKHTDKPEHAEAYFQPILDAHIRQVEMLDKQ